MPKVSLRKECAYQFQYRCASGKIYTYSSKKQLDMNVKLHNKICQQCKDKSITNTFAYQKTKAINTVPSDYFNLFK